MRDLSQHNQVQNYNPNHPKCLGVAADAKCMLLILIMHLWKFKWYGLPMDGCKRCPHCKSNQL
ncbi:hypothetical protein Patl1_07720 [Pistacia atlantica]|uniref:Uncharacterized protein n=1 Tax=Pistacia atlantica TaxID=434234 RepID=A0ACC1AIA5_9ROSI|nr:hypothetical protein Patl1_07720 [Pistacia atlantica]